MEGSCFFPEVFFWLKVVGKWVEQLDVGNSLMFTGTIIWVVVLDINLYLG